VFFGGGAAQGVEPVGKVGSAVAHGPISHAGSHSIGQFGVHFGSLVDAFKHLFGLRRRKPFLHGGVVEHQFGKIVRDGGLRSGIGLKFVLSDGLNGRKAWIFHFTLKI